MRILKRLLFLLCLSIVPTSVFAQATLAGIVRDSSGGVLPGVTVEATSPSIIEKSRVATTDGTGQYRITDLTPGNYTVSSPGWFRHDQTREHRFDRGGRHHDQCRDARR